MLQQTFFWHHCHLIWKTGADWHTTNSTAALCQWCQFSHGQFTLNPLLEPRTIWLKVHHSTELKSKQPMYCVRVIQHYYNHWNWRGLQLSLVIKWSNVYSNSHIIGTQLCLAYAQGTDYGGQGTGEVSKHVHCLLLYWTTCDTAAGDRDNTNCVINRRC